MNEAHATVGSSALVLGTSDEKALGQRATAIERQATSMVVNSDVGYAAAGEDCRTRTPGVFVAGDCRAKGVRQLTTAVADGAVAALAAVHWIDHR